jgi:hypothetical protein
VEDVSGRGRVNREGEGGSAWWIYFVLLYDNRTVTLVEIVLRRRGRMMQQVNLLRYIMSTYVNVTMNPLYNYYTHIKRCPCYLIPDNICGFLFVFLIHGASED